MRVSVDEADPGYIDSPTGWDVSLDGVLIELVITADEEVGFVLKYRIPLEVINDLLQVEELWGVVVVTERDPRRKKKNGSYSVKSAA